MKDESRSAIKTFCEKLKIQSLLNIWMHPDYGENTHGNKWQASTSIILAQYY